MACFNCSKSPEPCSLGVPSSEFGLVGLHVSERGGASRFHWLPELVHSVGSGNSSRL